MSYGPGWKLHRQRLQAARSKAAAVSEPPPPVPGAAEMTASGARLSDETRAKMKAAAQRRAQDPAWRSKLAEAAALGRERRREKRQQVAGSTATATALAPAPALQLPGSLEERVTALEARLAASEARRGELLGLLQALERRLAALVERPPAPDWPPWAPWPGEARPAPASPPAAESVDDVPIATPTQAEPVSDPADPVDEAPPAVDAEAAPAAEPVEALSGEDAAVAQLARLRRPKRKAPLLLASAEPVPIAERPPVVEPAAEAPPSGDEDPPPQPASAARLPAPGAADEDVTGWTFRRALPGVGDSLYWTGGFSRHQDRTGKPFRLPVFGPRRCASTFAELRLARDAQRFTPELKGLFIVELT